MQCLRKMSWLQRKERLLVRLTPEAAVEAREREADRMRTWSTNVTTESIFVLQELGGKPARTPDT